jgi:hypothetical protein
MPPTSPKDGYFKGKIKVEEFIPQTSIASMMHLSKLKSNKNTKEITIIEEPIENLRAAQSRERPVNKRGG